MSREPLLLDILIVPRNGVDLSLVPVTALVEYFTICNVTLHLTWTNAIQYDPADSQTLASFVKTYAPPDGETGQAILVLGTESSKYGKLVNGELLNPAKRGIIQVYTESAAFSSGDDETRLQIFIHEIGHLINLVHAEAVATYPTAMAQYDVRHTTRPILDIWHASNSDLTPEDRDRFRAYFSKQRAIFGLPMSRASLDHAARWPIADIAPWLSSFHDTSPSGSFDGGTPGLSMNCKQHQQRISLGQGLDFTLTIALDSSAAPASVPAHIELRFGNMAIFVQRHLGRVTTLRADTHTCASGTKILKPGGHLRSAHSFLHDREALVFSAPGRYRVEVTIPRLGLRSPPMYIDVDQSAVPELVNKRFLRFLSGPMPLTARASWKRLDQLTFSSSTPAALRATLAELSIRARPNQRNNPTLFELVRSLPDVPQRIQERIALARCSYESKYGTQLTAAVADARAIFKRSNATHPAFKAIVANAESQKRFAVPTQEDPRQTQSKSSDTAHLRRKRAQL